MQFFALKNYRFTVSSKRSTMRSQKLFTQFSVIMSFNNCTENKLTLVQFINLTQILLVWCTGQPKVRCNIIRFCRFVQSTSQSGLAMYHHKHPPAILQSHLSLLYVSSITTHCHPPFLTLWQPLICCLSL